MLHGLEHLGSADVSVVANAKLIMIALAKGVVRKVILPRMANG